ncbi:MAG: guanylate kinase, partial [Anaerolineae bacterium]
SVRKRMEEVGCPVRFVVTATDRPRRKEETDGVDYHFISTEEFERMIEEGEFLEHAIVYGQYKGIPKESVRQPLARGEDVFLRIDVQGAKTIREIAPEALLIFLSASSMRELIKRLRERKTESAEEMMERVATVQREMRYLPEFDYVVINREGRLDEAVEEIMAIIRAEKCRVHPRQVSI